MMSGQISAEIGHWYHLVDKMEIFEVVAIDYDDQYIEIQYFDGEIEQLDFSSWKTLTPVEAAAPEDWTGLYETARQDPAFNDYAINEALISTKRKAS